MFSRLKVPALSVLFERPAEYSSSENGSFCSSRVVDESEGEMRCGWFGADGDVTDRACKLGRGWLVGGKVLEEELAKELKAPGVMTPGSLAGESLTSEMNPD